MVMSRAMENVEGTNMAWLRKRVTALRAVCAAISHYAERDGRVTGKSAGRVTVLL
jgi:hypothetical protein